MRYFYVHKIHGSRVVDLLQPMFPMAARARNTIPERGITPAFVLGFRTSRPPVSGNFENTV
nr:MAG TPA: hypothetical protein [Caudoviricetes sp.]